jgi:RNA polymerase sigma factor FliA
VSSLQVQYTRPGCAPWMCPPGRDALVMEHMPLARSIAVRMRETLPPSVEIEDLTSHGVLGLLDAASRYDPAKRIAFGIYARHRIRGAILDSLRDLDAVSRQTRRQHRRIESATQELSLQLQRTPTGVEVSEKLSLSPQQLSDIAVQLQNATPVSTDTRTGDALLLPVPDYAASPDSRPDVVCTKEQMKAFVDRAIASLTPCYRKVVTMYYTGEMTMKQIGASLGINESRVSQIHKLALAKLNRSLQAAGIHSASALC